LAQDPGETQDLSDTQVKTVKEFQRLRDARLPPLPEASQQDEDGRTVSEAIIRKRLQDLGFL